MAEKSPSLSVHLKNEQVVKDKLGKRKDYKIAIG